MFLISALLGISANAVAGSSVVASHSSVGERVISVTGSAAASIEPDLVIVRFGVETRQETSQAALTANAGLMHEVVKSLRNIGIDEDEISTSRFNIHAVYESQQDKLTGRRSQVLAGYVVSNIIMVKTGKLGRVAAVIDAAVEAGVNRVEGVQFTLSPDILAGLKEQLIEQAVLNARSKAEKALAPLNHVITGVRNMSLSDFTAPAPMYTDTPRMEMAHSAPTQIFSSNQEVRTTVQVTFLIGEDAG